jgi:hypothetical protein
MVTQRIHAFIASEYMEAWGNMDKHKHCQTEGDQHCVMYKSYMSMVKMTRNMYSSNVVQQNFWDSEHSHNYTVIWQLKELE